MKKPIRFLIPNVTSASNIGDEAMLEVLIGLITENYPDAHITVQSSEPETHAIAEIKKLNSTFYYWAVFENPSILSRLYRMSLLAILCVGLYFSLWSLISLVTSVSARIKSMLFDYEHADVIVYVGGGYLRSKAGFSQSLNVVMLLLPFWLAKFFTAKRIVAPISIGPFAAEWQARLTGAILHTFETVATREKFSYKTISKYKPKNLILASDHALLLSKKTGKQRKSAVPIVGFTIREWLGDARQKQLETAYIDALEKIAKAQNIVIQPIVQVDAPKFGEGDGVVTERVAAALRNRGIAVKPAVFVTSVEHAKQVYKPLSLLVGMRMHSNIIAGTQGVPFVPVSYEYKTEGIAIDFGLSEFCIKCFEITAETLLSHIEHMLEHRDSLSKRIEENLKRIQRKEQVRWLKVLSV
ncbi:polysaccharide pyruvyl transferase family protein [Candidatus Woesebacteria bacterium]|nr:polysaccharide pyruvyl transferase family protein [Candidatus Woesebacteria bacterium]